MKTIHSLTRILRGYVLFSAVIGGLVTTVAAAPGEVDSFLKLAKSSSELESLPDFGLFGGSCATLGDLDGDGIPELAVGARGNGNGVTDSKRGALYILFLDADGTVRKRTKIADNAGGFGSLSDSDAFAISCATLGDLDGDGISELAVGATGDDTGGTDSNRGALYILFLDADGTVRKQTKIADSTGGFGSLSPQDSFGGSCATLGDLDGDGIPELAVGATGDDTGGADSNKGALYILFLDAEGTVRDQTKIADSTGGFGSLSSQDLFGGSCATLGDLDGDGIPELAVGATGDDTGGTDSNKGALYILFLDAEGTVRDQTKIADSIGGFGSLSSLDSFGGSCATLGDLNGDGIPELAVGSIGDDTLSGALYILFLETDGTVREQTKIGDSTGGFGSLSPQDLFGSSCATLGDLDGDGIPELAVGAIGEGALLSGALYILSLGDPPLVVDTGLDEFDTPSTDGSGAVSLREAIRDAKATGEFRTIVFESSLQGSTLPLTMGPLEIDGHSVAIRGGPSGSPTISGAGTQRVFRLTGGAVATLECLQVADGFISGNTGGGVFVSQTSSLVAKDVEFRDCRADGDLGGAIGSAGKLRVERCTFAGNEAEAGGAILSGFGNAELTVLNSTFSGNTATDAVTGGGAILNFGDGTFGFPDATIRFSTFAENSAPSGAGGAIFVSSGGGTVKAENSLYAGNSASTGQNDSGPISLTLVPEIPLNQLAPLGDFGGKTTTRPLLAGSTAIDAAFFLPLPTTDQRGMARSDGRPDLGAVEGPSVPPVVAAAILAPDNSAAKAALSKKIKKLKKKAKASKRKGQVAKAKKLKKKIKKLTKKLRAL